MKKRPIKFHNPHSKPFENFPNVKAVKSNEKIPQIIVFFTITVITLVLLLSLILIKFAIKLSPMPFPQYADSASGTNDGIKFQAGIVNLQDLSSALSTYNNNPAYLKPSLKINTAASNLQNPNLAKDNNYGEQKAVYAIYNEGTIFVIVITSIALVATICLILFLYIRYVKKSSKKSFEHIANTDNVTGCSSFSKFSADTENLLANNNGKKYAFIYSNVENFKLINDLMGFDFGNDLLKFIVEVLADNLTEGELFSRITADRFGILMEYEDNDSLIKRLEEINKNICVFQTRHNLKFELKLYYGIYKIKDMTLPANAISDRALLALQNLSTNDSTGESNYGFYNSSIRQKALLEKELENDMQQALDNKNFIVYLQPKFNLTHERIIGAEALVRWLHPTRGLIPPNQFIPLFEANGFILKLDFYMFEATCSLLSKWIESGKNPVPISVNLSRVHLYNPNIAEELYCIALKYNVPTNLIEIELTENLDFDNMTMLLNVVARLKSFDFNISIDDFGSGYSSLNILKDLPVDVLKIDREFFSEASDEKRGRQVIASIIDMAKRLDMKTVAEGVEVKDQADFLTSINCDYVQGFYFSKPVTIMEFESKYIACEKTCEMA